MQQPPGCADANAAASSNVAAAVAAAAAAASEANARAIQALNSRLDADRATASADTAALQTQLASIVAMLAQQRASTQPTPSIPATAAPLTATPHRAAVLDRATASADLTRQFDTLHDIDSDDEAQQVTHQTHTRQQPTIVLPSAFVPAQSGSEQSAQQQLAAILSGLTKSTSKVKYANLSELNEALDDWAADSLRAGWSAAHMEALRRYQQQVVHRLGRSHPLKDVLEYHRRWCKAVHNGHIDMFAPGADLNLAILHEVSHPQQFGYSPAGGSTAQLARQRRPGRSAGAASTTAGAAARPPQAAKFASHPAGSCANHPASTTHTTAECRSK